MFVNAIEVNEEEVGNEHADDMLGKRITETQESGTQFMMALRNKEDTMHGAKTGVRDGGGGMQ